MVISMRKWPKIDFWPIRLFMAIWPSDHMQKNMGKWGIPGKSYKNVAQIFGHFPIEITIENFKWPVMDRLWVYNAENFEEHPSVNIEIKMLINPVFRQSIWCLRGEESGRSRDTVLLGAWGSERDLQRLNALNSESTSTVETQWVESQSGKGVRDGSLCWSALLVSALSLPGSQAPISQSKPLFTSEHQHSSIFSQTNLKV